MTTSHEPERPIRMDLPRPDGAFFAAVFSIVIFVFVAAAFVNFASYRFVPTYATVLSAIWLMIVAAGVYYAVTDDYGIRNFIVNRTAAFSRHHFVEVRQSVDNDQIVRFGFTFFKRRFTQLQIPASKIVSIEWRPGQATSTSGRDMNDWHVIVWYQRKGAKRYTETGYREEALHFVGPSGPRSKTATTGRGLLAFFESVGIVLFPSNECKFTIRNQRNGQITMP